MPKTPKKVSTKPVAKKATAKTKKAKEPKVTFMMKVLKQREEQRKQQPQGYPHSDKPMPHNNSARETVMKNTGFSRFAGPRRKAG